MFSRSIGLALNNSQPVRRAVRTAMMSQQTLAGTGARLGDRVRDGLAASNTNKAVNISQMQPVRGNAAHQASSQPSLRSTVTVTKTTPSSNDLDTPSSASDQSWEPSEQINGPSTQIKQNHDAINITPSAVAQIHHLAHLSGQSSLNKYICVSMSTQEAAPVFNISSNSSKKIIVTQMRVSTLMKTS